jgi:dipeptidyl aminopeptidase/acylaminoacyl peptidase
LKSKYLSKRLSRSSGPTLSLDDFFRARTVGASCWSPDSRWICFVWNASGRDNLWVAPSDGGSPLQLTVSRNRQTLGGWSPDGNWIVFQSDHNGNEIWDLFVVSLADGKVRNLTSTPEVSEERPRWSPDGKLLAYIARATGSPSYEVNVIEFATGEIQPITASTPPELSNFGPAWSPDGRRLAYTQTRADRGMDRIFVAEIATGKSHVVSPPGEHNHYAAAFSPDGRQLLITSNAVNGYRNVALLDWKTGKINWVTRHEWECRAGSFDPSGRFLTYQVNRDGNCVAMLYDTTTRRSRFIARRPGVNTPGSFAPDGGKVVFYRSGPAEPADIHTYSLREKKATRITESLLAGKRVEGAAGPRLVRYVCSDGLVIPAFLYVPGNLERNARNPAVVHVHGGPAVQHANGFHRGIQFLVANGYVVIAPNYRGSAGYGREFEERNRHDLGRGDLQDLVCAAGFLKSTGYVASDKIALMGASYGGYLTMLGLTKTPGIWAAGVAVFPFVNWFTELEHEDPALRQWDLAAMGDPVENHARYRERSPIYFADRIRAPVLILAGANDRRCPRSEAERIVKAIRKRAGVVKYKFYKNEGHGFTKPENAVDGLTRTAAFLNRYLR